MPAIALPVPSYILLIVLGAAGLYAASRAGVDALVRDVKGPRPGLAALGHWSPVAFVAWLAAAAGRSDLALGVIFGTSVAALSLVLGMTTWLAPPAALPQSRRAWPFLLAAAMLPLVAGFTGRLTPIHALMMFVLGLTILLVWQHNPREPQAVELPAGPDKTLPIATDPDLAFPVIQSAPGGTLDYAAGSAKRSPLDRTVLARFAQWLLALALAYLGARAVLAGAIGADQTPSVLRAGVLAATVFSPMLTLPMLSTGTELAQRGRGGEACGTYVAFAFLNLCLLLPAVALLWYVRSAAPNGGSLLVALGNLGPQAESIPLPLTVWRIDAVFLLVLGLALVPIGLGKWTMSRLEAVVFVIGYAAYLAVTAAVAKGRL